jgi:catechol 1,2-dioxygenase
VSLAQAWAVPLEQGIPVHQFTNLRGKFTTDTDGRFWFWTVKMDGVVGRLLKLQGRHPYRPAHVHALVFRAGYKTVISGVCDPSDPSIDSDGQSGVTQGADRRLRPARRAEPGMTGDWGGLACA